MPHVVLDVIDPAKVLWSWCQPDTVRSSREFEVSDCFLYKVCRCVTWVFLPTLLALWSIRLAAFVQSEFATHSICVAHALLRAHHEVPSSLDKRRFCLTKFVTSTRRSEVIQVLNIVAQLSVAAYRCLLCHVSLHDVIGFQANIAPDQIRQSRRPIKNTFHVMQWFCLILDAQT